MTEHANVFLYGTLRDPDLLAIVAGGRLADLIPASLPDYAVSRVADQSFPLIRKENGSIAHGTLIEVDPEQRARLDFYELGFGYALEGCLVETGEGTVEALVYIPEAPKWSPDGAWSLADWVEEHGVLTRNAAEEYMRLYGQMSSDAAAGVFPQVRMRAASRLRAKREPSPALLSPKMRVDGTKTHDTRQPYTDYFAVREDVISFPRFDGKLSEPVRRAAFMGGDAVTILPFDPRTDNVLVVRQFRYGAYVRADRNPWCVEPVAGRIDPGEEPDEAARREMLEETGLTPSELYRIAAYYPSPAAYSEFLISYVSITDLSDADGSVGGVASEAEDIMAHVMPFARLVELIDNGAANTAPLILSAQWLAANRDRLRAAD